jgi:cytidylate kinase|tara:strand:- start:1540 stop:2202 length:663 start_codon:yes stop_codon:yes gene_type:complete
MIITIDGPSSSGKSTLAKLISDHFSIIHIDSGSIYRTITLLAIENKLIIDKKVQVEKLIECLNNNVITFKKNAENKFQICINNEFVESKIRSTTISNNVSTVATIKEIRDYVLKLQREIAQNKSIVMDGRDIGSVVFPNAEYKFYLDASLKNRSKRRWTELKDGEKNITITTVESDLENRDIIDSNRVHSPLVIPENAIVINSDDLSINQVLKKILHFIK